MSKATDFARREKLAKKEAAALGARSEYLDARAKLLREKSRAKKEEIRGMEKRERLLSRIAARVSAKRKAYFGSTRHVAFHKKAAPHRKVAVHRTARLLPFRAAKTDLPRSFIVLYVIAAMIFVYAVLLLATPSQMIEYNMDLGVNSYTGFNVDTDAIHLGTIMPGSTAKRNLFIANSNEVLTFVRITVEGNLSQWAQVGDNNFFLLGNANKTVSIWATAPADAAYGNYTATVSIITKRLI